MSLSNLQVFTRTAYSSFTEVLRQQVDLFNTATNGALILRSGTTTGDYEDQSFWQKLSGLVRRRDAYATGAVSPIALTQLLDTSVRVDAGTPPIQIDPHWFQRIESAPGEEGVIIGRQLAVDTLADMLNTGVSAVVAALGQVAAVVNDYSATGKLSLRVLNTSAAKFGDRASDLRVHIVHSTPMHDLYDTALANAERLFSHDSVNVIQDGFGRRFVMTDAPGLFNATPTPDEYHTLTLAPGGLMIQRNNDFLDNLETSNGDESLRRTYQAQWSYNIAIRGFAWDKANGGKSPTDAELLTATNWDKTVTDNKDLAGVLTITQ